MILIITTITIDIINTISTIIIPDSIPTEDYEDSFTFTGGKYMYQPIAVMQ